MRAYYRVSGAVRLEMKRGSTYSYEVDQDGGRRLIVSKDEYEELADQIRDGDEVRAELKRSLDDALGQIERLGDERDTWQSAAHSHAADLARMVDENKRLKDERDGLRFLQHTAPSRMVLSHETSDKVLDTMFRETTTAYRTNRARLEGVTRERDDLKDTIVSQAREIARLKGESE